MIRRLLTTLLPALALGACGMPDDGEWPVDEQGQVAQAVEISAGFAVSPGGGKAYIPQADDTGVVAAPTPANVPVLFMSTGGASSPGGAVSSTQDPIPAKNRRDSFDSKSKVK
ncbi:MAG: hypothetical protein ACOX6T_22195 [Myxococcales bacterium]|jgi:hypothetical protein